MQKKEKGWDNLILNCALQLLFGLDEAMGSVEK